MASSDIKYTDVLVCGAGPVGLLIALGLAQQGIDTRIIEKRGKGENEKQGRASTLMPRSLELLDTMDLTGEMIQNGFVARASANYKDGKRVTARGWHSIFSSIGESYHDYILNIRQNSSRRIFTARYKADFGKDIHHGWKIESFEHDSAVGDGYNITAQIAHASEGTQSIRCKYLVGADGGHSTVRELAGIVREGDETTYRWIRIDAKMKTDMPEPDLGFAAIETEEYGNVLWVKLDRDAHRIGISLNPRLQAKYPGEMTETDVIEEATNALRPFKVEVERVDWWTIYSIKQKVAETLKKGHVLLAGDAAHTHSSGFAQGMNTGIHDATNLVWKLAGTLKGLYKSDVLETYNTERHAMASKLISIDKLAAAAISGSIPEQYRAPGGSNHDAVFTILKNSMSFTMGLGVSYGESIISAEPTVASIEPGARSPDGLIHHPGPSIPTRLHTLSQNKGKGRWNLIVFVGSHVQNGTKVAALRDAMQHSSRPFSRWQSEFLNLFTLIVGTVGGAWAAFGGPAVGDLYFDTESRVHGRYGISPANGGIVIIRPDGVFAFAAGLHELDKVEGFFQGILVSQN